MVCQVTNWPRWRAVPTQADLVSLLCLKISHLLTPPPPYHSCSLKNFRSHFLPFFLNQYAPQLLVLDIWFGNLKLTHCLFFARTLKEELGYLGCWRAAAVHMISKTGSRPSLIGVYTARQRWDTRAWQHILHVTANDKGVQYQYQNTWAWKLVLPRAR